MRDKEATDAILVENRRRRQIRDRPFDPVSGEGSVGERFRLPLREYPGGAAWLPVAMQGSPIVEILDESGGIEASAWKIAGECRRRDKSWVREVSDMIAEAFVRERVRHDFPYWAATFVKIKQKGGGLDGPFVLNRPQRRLLGVLEEMRCKGEPIRLILLKARQWGGSTCVQLYMAWLQMVHSVGLNSLIIAHQGAGSDEIMDMFGRMVSAYPAELLTPAGEPVDYGMPKMTRAGKSGSSFRVPQRDCKVKIGTAERPDSCRGGDYNLVHLSEVGIWKQTAGKCPEDIVRSACAGVLLKPMTMIVMESTANGRGNFFHREYLAAREGESQFRPLFVAWYEIDTYSLPFADGDEELEFARRLWEKRDETVSSGRREAGSYLWSLWNRGATLEAIRWYEAERAKYSDHSRMASEFPSDDIEAFAHSGVRVFSPEAVERMRADTEHPQAVGEVVAGNSSRIVESTVRFIADSSGKLSVWRYPSTSDDWRDRYLTVVDIGGRSDSSDWSVVMVLDRVGADAGAPRPEVVAQWRGHTDHDLLARTAAAIAAWYHDSLLVIESNTLETSDATRDTDGNQTPYLLQQLEDVYPNLYVRNDGNGRARPGFHTNTSTKPMVIGALVKEVREHGYAERDLRCLDELEQYERRPNGSYGAITGCHDDMLMTRAIALHISTAVMDPPVRRAQRSVTPRRRPSGREFGI